MRHAIATLLLVCLVATAVSCAKKPPRTPPIAAPPVEVPPPPPPPAPPPDATEQPLPADLQQLNAELARRGLIGDVFFAFDVSTLDAEARQRLAKNAEFLTAQRQYEVTIEGHCDERGTSEYNLALGDRRAAAAAGYLTSLGVAAARLRTVTYGEERPQCTDGNEPCWARNRRARFVITGRRDLN